MRGARIVVAIAYIILGASFLASTGLLIQEFRALDWESMLIANSHLFFFFPVFGILALAAFYLPSVVFADLLAASAPRQGALPGRARRPGGGVVWRGQVSRCQAAGHLGGLAAGADGRQRRSGGLRRGRE